LKKLFFIISLIFLSITSSYAVFFIDAQGDYIATGELEPVTGGALGIGFSITDDLNFLIKSAYASNTEKKGKDDEFKYNYSYVTGGIEYIPPVAVLEEYRIYWKNSLNIGPSTIEGEYPKAEDSEKKSEDGYICSFWTGLQFNLTQYIAPYFDLGYHKSFFASDVDVSIKGWQVAAGIRFYIGGSRDYDANYK